MGSEPFLSSSWYRVARLRPKLRDHARIRRHRYRGRIWYVLDDRLSSRVHRLSPSAYIFVALMDGRRTVDDLWSNVVRQNGESAPTQDEIVHLLAQLHASDLLQSDISPDSLEVFDRFVTQKRTRLKQMLLNPMSLRLPIFDPDPFLERTLPLVRPLLGWFGGLLWFAVVIPALVLAAGRWSELSENVTDRLLATENLLLLSLVFPVVKLLHELGHGYATKVFGGAVHEFGIMLIMGMPTPYVDASSSSGFRNKSRRALVGAAGMIVEVFVAALALHVWRIAEPGAVRTLCFNVITVAGVSTLIFNGNPLMRYDGYYILIDVLEIPNLASRSAQLWRAMVDKYAFRVADARIPAGAPGELKWLVSYAPAAFMYRSTIRHRAVSCRPVLFHRRIPCIVDRRHRRPHSSFQLAEIRGDQPHPAKAPSAGGRVDCGIGSGRGHHAGDRSLPVAYGQRGRCLAARQRDPAGRHGRLCSAAAGAPGYDRSSWRCVDRDPRAAA